MRNDELKFRTAMIIPFFMSFEVVFLFGVLKLAQIFPLPPGIKQLMWRIETRGIEFAGSDGSSKGEPRRKWHGVAEN